MLIKPIINITNPSIITAPARGTTKRFDIKAMSDTLLKKQADKGKMPNHADKDIAMPLLSQFMPLENFSEIKGTK